MDIVKRQNQSLATITSDQFLKGFDPVVVQKTYRDVNDFPAVFKSGTYTLGEVRRAYGYDFTQAYIELWILDLIRFFSVGQSMNEHQVPQSASLILDSYPSLNIADINLVFKRGKMGYYGQLYGRLDGQVILGWFSKHFEDRCNAAAEESANSGGIYNRDPYERTSVKNAGTEHEFKLEKFNYENNKKQHGNKD